MSDVVRSQAAKKNWSDPAYRSRQMAARPRFVGTTNQNYKHGGRTAQLRSEYHAYWAAKARCTDPNNVSFANYGGRGIQFLFQSFEQFLSELGPKPNKALTLDRIQTDGNYEPGNVRWATRKEQVNNRRLKRIENFSDEDLLQEVRRRGLHV